MNKFIIVLLSICTSVMAQVMLKVSSKMPLKSLSFLISLGFAMLCYLFSFIGYSFSLRYYPLSKISPIMAVAVMILVVGVGFIAFKEKMSLFHLAGIVLGLVSVALISKS